MTGPRISVAMSVYNGERFLAEAIESVLAQSFTDFEFLILDDGSRDGSRTIIETYAAKDARIRPIIRQNRGLVVSLNQLIDEARAPLIARMDADDVCLPERFARQISFLDAHLEHGIIGSRIDLIDPEGHPLTQLCEGYPLDHSEIIRNVERKLPFLCHPAVMMRRDVVLAVGGYHKAFRHCEDYDLWLRLASVTQIANLPERLLKYRRSATQVSNRHSGEQIIGAAIAYTAYEERLAGRPDPTEHLEGLPRVAQLDELFGRPGIAAAVRAKVAPALLYSHDVMTGKEFSLLTDYLRENGGPLPGGWQTVLRLIKWRAPIRGSRLALSLLGAR